jgi:hypothetical protein
MGCGRSCLVGSAVVIGLVTGSLLTAHHALACPAALAQGQHWVTHEIYYLMPDAAEVVFVWGLNGWQALPEIEFPPGTVLENSIMHTPMARDGDLFFARVRVPEGALIDYGFLITKARAAVGVPVYEAAGDPIPVMQEASILVQTNLMLTDDGAVWKITGAPMVSHLIRYHLPEADQVELVWGINGWHLLPEKVRPAGTALEHGTMHTPMAYEGDAFVARVAVPEGAAIDYGFLITGKRGVGAIQAIWDGSTEYLSVATYGGVSEVQAAVTLEATKVLPGYLNVGLYLAAGVGLFAGIGLLLRHFPAQGSRHLAVLTLLGLTMLALALRLVVAGTTTRLLGASPQLIGDEFRYEELAYGLVQGDFFPWPGATPVYPIFLAACYLVFGHSYAAVLYVQAFVGATAIPLSFWLARRFTGTRSSLFAASIVALLPALIFHVGYLYTEVLYTSLLLLTVVSSLWALEARSLWRTAAAGALLGITALCRPATAVLLFLPLALPLRGRIRRKLVAAVVYSAAMAAVIAPWAHHNYRTHHEFIPFSVSLAVLWQGSPEFYHLMQEKEDAIIEIWNEELNPERNGGVDSLSIEGDRYFRARALASIQAEPGVYIWYSLQKLAFFWLGHPALRVEWPFDFALARTYYPAWQIAGLLWARPALLIATFASLFVLRHRLEEFAPLLLVCGAFTLTYAILLPLARHSQPLYPMLAVMIVAAGEAVGLTSDRATIEQGVAIQ